jgi:predicted nucleotide-binding protein (sugar kinase/HSP70/actin superfamily)
MILLVIFNAIMLARIFFPKVKLIKFFAAAALLFFCAIVAVNPEAYVARSNIQRYGQTGKIDAAYLFTLSGDAISETCDFVKTHPEAYDAAARAAMQSKYQEYARICSYDWQSQNFAVRNAYYKMQDLS